MIFSPVKVNNKGEIINPRSAVDRLMLFYAIWLTKSYFAKRMKEFAFNISCSAKRQGVCTGNTILIITGVLLTKKLNIPYNTRRKMSKNQMQEFQCVV